MNKLTFFAYIVSSLFLATAAVPVASARVNTLSGGVSTSYEYQERTYTGETTTTGTDGQTTQLRPNERHSRFILSPTVSIVSETMRDKAEFDYTPSFYYDVSQSDSNVDHKLLASYHRSLTQFWEITLADNYRKTEQLNDYSTPVTSANGTGSVTSVDTAIASAGSQLRDEPGRRRYSTNNLYFATDYAYAQDSLISFAYTWSTLRNDVSAFSGYQDYDKHAFAGSGSYRFDPRWKITGYGNYIRGLFDTVGVATDQGTTAVATQPSDDLRQYRAGATLESDLIPHQPLSLNYDYSTTRYDSSLQNDSQIHSLTLGWKWSYSPRLEFAAGAGPSYIIQDNADNTWRANGNASVNYSLEKGSIKLAVDGGTEYQNFSGTTQDQGLTKYWQVRTDLTYNLLRDLTSTLYGLYRDESRDQVTASSAIDQTSSSTETGTAGTVISRSNGGKRYAAGGSITYQFWQYYSASLSYSYVRWNADLVANAYEDNRVIFTVAYNNDLLRW